MDDLSPKDRDPYVENVLPLAHQGSQFLLFCFEWPARWWERLLPFAWGRDAGSVHSWTLFEILPLVMLSTPLLFLGLIIFLVRIGWRAFRINPLGKGSERWLFFGTIWTTFWAFSASGLSSISSRISQRLHTGSFWSSRTLPLWG